jgi:hypothetical protein
MRNVSYDRKFVAGRSARRIHVAALGTLWVAFTACSGFSDDCAATRTCAPSRPEAGASGGADAGNNAGAAGTGAAGAAVTTSSGGAPGASDTGGSAGVTSTGARGNAPSDIDASSGPDGGDGVDSGGTREPDGGVDAGDNDSGPLVCPPGFADCNGDRTDGCEVNVQQDADHCGVCTTVCATAGTTARACVAGACKPTCDAKHGDCDGLGANGCEIDLTTSAADCGACKRACSATHATAESCVAGVCKPTCGAGFADCSTPASPAPDNACETSLTASTSCGACGHDCQGGACQSGQCQPVVLQSGVTGVTQLAADATYVYYTDYGPSSEPRVMRASAKTQGSPNVVVDDLNVGSLVSDGSYAYWSVSSNAAAGDPPNGAIMRLPSGQLGATAIQSGIYPMFLAADGKNVYWTDLNQQNVWQAGRDGGSTKLHLFDDPYPNSLLSDGTTLYAASVGESRLFAVPVGGGAVTQLTAQNGGMDPAKSVFVTVDPTHVYAWFAHASGDYALYQMSKPTLGGGRLLTTGDARAALSRPVYFGNYVYYAQDDGVYRVSTTAASPQGARFVPAESIQNLVFANGNLYFVDYSATTQKDTIERLVLY